MANQLLPAIVYQMCVHGAFIVGSYAKFIVGDIKQTGNDYDLLVPLEKWQTIALLIPKDATPNKFGGWRFFTRGQDDVDVEVDVWPDTLENYLTKCKTKYGGSVYAIDYINNRVFSSKTMVLED